MSYCSGNMSGLVVMGEILLWLSLDLSGWIGEVGGSDLEYSRSVGLKNFLIGPQ